MKSLLVILLLATFSFSIERLLVLPTWTEPGCTTQSPFTPPPSPEYEILVGFERDAFIAAHQLDSCRQAACLFSASQSAPFSYLLLIRQQRIDSTSCTSSAEMLEAKSLKSLMLWQNIDSNSNWVKSADSILSAKYREKQVGTLSLTSVPENAIILGLPTGPASSPLNQLQLPVGKYPIQVTLTHYSSLADTLHIEAGKSLEKKYELSHTKAYHDSLAEVQRKARQDSLIARAKQTPDGQLSALFHRLLNIPVQGTSTIAILPFQCTLDSLQMRKLGYHPGLMASEYGISLVRADKRFQLVERQQLDLIMQEQALQQTGLTEGSATIDGGKILSVQYLIVGRVEVSQGQQRFFAKMIHTQTGEIVSAATAATPAQQNEELYRTALGERASVSGALFRSALAPGWGQFYTGNPGHGTAFLLLTAATVGHLVYRVINYQDKVENVDRFKDHDPSTVVIGESDEDWANRANHTINERNKAGVQVNIALAGVGAVWLLNMIDAYWLGNASAQAIRTEYFSIAPFAVPGNFGLNASLSF